MARSQGVGQRERRRGDIAGPWTLLEFRGRGGNAEVWLATRDGGATKVAVKFVRRWHGEPYRRFVQEVRTLRGLGSFPGILPMLDASLAENPSPADPPWISMPDATPIA